MQAGATCELGAPERLPGFSGPLCSALLSMKQGHHIKLVAMTRPGGRGDIWDLGGSTGSLVAAVVRLKATAATSVQWGRRPWVAFLAISV